MISNSIMLHFGIYYTAEKAVMLRIYENFSHTAENVAMLRKYENFSHKSVRCFTWGNELQLSI
uniref:Uncharacterized protein n=1 Tax=Rhizophora mucronata TaxID=61149 RepID=A0A2P2QXA1_RHIMU